MESSLSEQNRLKVAEAAKALRAEALVMLKDMTAIPADATTGTGYPETVAYLKKQLATFAPTEEIDVPQSYLDDHWGSDLSLSREYLPVYRAAPRVLVTAMLPGRSDEIGIHLNNNYDLYWGPRKERAGSIAQILALKAIAKSGVKLDKSAFLSATPDAYIGGETGAGYLVQQGMGRSPVVLASSLGGPDIVTAGYKGHFWAKITAFGKATHGSRPTEGVNAIEGMMAVQDRVRKLAQEFTAIKTPLEIVPAHANTPTIVMCRIAANLDVTFIPDECALYVDRRMNPEEKLDDAMAVLRELVADASRETGMRMEVSFPHTVSSSYTPPEHPLHKALSDNLKAVTGREPRSIVWSHYLGLHYFTAGWGSAAVAYTPGAVDHGKVVIEAGDPTVSDDELMAAIEVIALTIYDLTTSGAVDA
ncbi:peptidase dimerization domain-containing protein [Bosea sp. 2RAB26]|uniref:peptidase dimerization domain-containing protein n=1 Tax=Bosea sp. 2RAB26 TaxID=3237476 RepID=UPI003F8FD65D